MWSRCAPPRCPRGPLSSCRRVLEAQRRRCIHERTACASCPVLGRRVRCGVLHPALLLTCAPGGSCLAAARPTHPYPAAHPHLRAPTHILHTRSRTQPTFWTSPTRARCWRPRSAPSPASPVRARAGRGAGGEGRARAVLPRHAVCAPCTSVCCRHVLASECTRAPCAVGDTIPINYNNKRYFIDIVEAKPGAAISVIETDCNVRRGSGGWLAGGGALLAGPAAPRPGS